MLSAAQIEFGSCLKAVQIVCKNAMLERNDKCFSDDKVLLSSAAGGVFGIKSSALTLIEEVIEKELPAPPLT